ncbi:hypothetical protein GCM10007856_40530 [Azospirillum oryzae]|nr:hypothetical protein GCM10007856_40530 [Azospirillum oryzae]
MSSEGFVYDASPYVVDGTKWFVCRGRWGLPSRSCRSQMEAESAAEDIDEELDLLDLAMNEHVPPDWRPKGKAKGKSAIRVLDPEIPESYCVWKVAPTGFVVGDDNGLLPGWFKTAENAIQATLSYAARRPPGL